MAELVDAFLYFKRHPVIPLRIRHLEQIECIEETVPS
jgi:hypothetical protein